MNLYEIIIEVLKVAKEKGVSLENDWEREDIATEIYDMFYSSEIIGNYISNGYIEDLKDYWEENNLND